MSKTLTNYLLMKKQLLIKKQLFGGKNYISKIYSSCNPWTKTTLLSPQLCRIKQLKKKPKQLSFRQ